MKRFTAIKWAREVPTLLHNDRVDRVGHHLLLILATYGRNDGTDIWVSVNTLAREVHVSVGDCEATLKRLDDAGLITPTAASNGAPGWSLNLSLVHDGDVVMESRLERRREADRNRKRRHRKRLREAGHATVDRDVTQESGRKTVTLVRDEEKGVTHECHGVTGECHACHASGTVTPAGQDGCNSLINSLNSPLSLTDAAHRRDSENQPSPEAEPRPAPAEHPETAKRKKTTSGYTDAFEAWWALYPRKVDKHAASRKFAAALKHTSLDTLTTGVKRYATETTDRQPEHVKHAATWLHGRCWENNDTSASAERTAETATDWVRAEWKAGRVKPIEHRTGLHYTPPDLPLRITGRDAIEVFYANACREWIAANHDEIIARLTRSTL